MIQGISKNLDEGNNSMRILHQNIQSLRENFDHFTTYLQGLLHLTHAIVLSETWIYSHECCDYKIPSYNLIANCNDSYRSGGIALYIHESISVRDYQNFNLSSADIIVINLSLDSNILTLICVYRFYKRNNISIFCDELKGILDLITSKNVVILGDINVNILNSAESYDYMMLLAAYGLESLVNEPTRVSSGTCIDYLFVKFEINHDISVSNLNMYLSDHNLIALTIDCKASDSTISSFSELEINRINYEKLKNYLILEDWSSVYNASNCSNAYHSFLSKFCNYVSICTTKSVIRKRNKLKPWMTDGLLSLSDSLKWYSRKLRKHPSNHRLERYVSRLRKKLKTAIKSTKESYFKNKFRNADGNPKKMWRVTDEILCRSGEKSKISVIHSENHSCLTTDTDIAEEFNKFFLKTSEDVSSSFEGTEAGNSSERHLFIHGNFPSSLKSCYFQPISVLEVIKEIKLLKNSQSKGNDGINSVLIKNCSWFIADVLCDIFNYCISSGCFPDILKSAIIVPIFKKGDRLKLSNYRPISLLNSFSKIFEKLLKKRLIVYLEKINFLSNAQFGFTSNKSTEDALIHFLSPIYSAFNQQKRVIALFVDIAKAFDSVDHNILIEKMSCIGIRGPILRLFKSYLNNRTQAVRIGNIVSTARSLNVGVPQGSVLGPLLFLIYFNSLFNVGLSGNFTAFADDVGISYISPSLENAEDNLKCDLNTLMKWFNYHKMLLSDKSKIMYFSPTGLSTPATIHKYHSVRCTKTFCFSKCISLETVTKFKYLGLFLDCNLNWKHHINLVKNRVLMTIRKFYSLRNVCPISVTRVIYQALVESVIMYGIVCWGGTYFSNINDLYKAQKWIVKLMYFMPRSTQTVSFFIQKQLLPLRYLYVFRVLKLFFYKSGSFHQRNIVVYNMRNANMYVNVRCNLELYRRFYAYMGPFWFHKLPREIKMLSRERGRLFEKKTKKWIMEIQNIEDYF